MTKCTNKIKFRPSLNKSNLKDNIKINWFKSNNKPNSTINKFRINKTRVHQMKNKRNQLVNKLQLKIMHKNENNGMERQELDNYAFLTFLNIVLKNMFFMHF